LVRELRDDINKMLELARNDKLIGASLDAAAYVYVADENKRSLLNKLVGDEDLISPPVKTNGVDDLRTALMLSQVALVDSPEAVCSACDESYITKKSISSCVVGVKKAEGTKCGRCWFYDNQVGKHGLLFDELCQRCNNAIFEWEKETNQQFELPLTEEQPVT
jgi:isoleucyl-tRNA synthetase